MMCYMNDYNDDGAIPMGMASFISQYYYFIEYAMANKHHIRLILFI